MKTKMCLSFYIFMTVVAYGGANAAAPSYYDDWELCAVGGFLGLQCLFVEDTSAYIPATVGMYGKYKKFTAGYQYTRSDLLSLIEDDKTKIYQEHKLVAGYTFLNNRVISMSLLGGNSFLLPTKKRKEFNGNVYVYRDNEKDFLMGGVVDLQLFLKPSDAVGFGRTLSFTFTKDVKTFGYTVYYIIGKFSKRHPK
jgi:hypothetical protein